MGKFARQFGEVFAHVASDIFKFCTLMRFVPTWQQEQLLGAVQRGDRQIAVRSGQGPGKCLTLTGSVLAVKNNGMAIKTNLRELAENQGVFQVPSMDPATETIAWRKARAFPSGQKPCVRLTVDSGQSLELSTDHPVYTPRGWVHAANLCQGDLVAMPRRLMAPPKPLAITDEEVRVVAGLLCDGNTCSRVQMTHLPGVFLDQFLRDVVALGGSWKLEKQLTKAVTASLNNMLPMVRRWGMEGVISKEKRVPPEFFGLSDRHLGIFLNTIWACDGYVTKDGFEITLASKPFIEDLQTLLLRFGIHSRFKFKRAKCQWGVFDAWKLTISGRDNILRLTESMGLPLGKEIQTEAMFELALKPTSNTNTDIVPVQVLQMQIMLAELGLSNQRGSHDPQGMTITSLRPKWRARNTSYWSRQKLQEFCKELNYRGTYAKWANNDIYWVKVERLEPLGLQPVYDLTVPETGNFVVQNLIVHNTTASVIVGLWRCLRAVNAMTVVTAPTMRQCNEVWLAEARRLLARADPVLQRLIEITRTKVMIAGRPDWGVKTVTATKEENAQGFHEQNMTILCEEASGIPRKIIEQFKGTASNPNCLFLQIGNPNTRDCAFFDCFHRDKAHWTCLHWNAEESPPSVVNPERNRLLAEEFGRDSDVYRVRVLGEFPHADPNCVLSSEQLEKVADPKLLLVKSACRRENRELIRQFGLDFARYGGDENTLFRRSGHSIIEWAAQANVDPSIFIAKAFAWQQQAGWRDEQCWYVADAGGMGQGLMHKFYEAQKQILEFNNGSRAIDSKEYENRITEAWFHFARLAKAVDCCIPADNTLLQQLAGRQYFTTAKGKLVLESKDEYMRRGNDSPDRADGLVLAFYDQVQAVGNFSAQGAARHRVGVGGRA